MSIRPKGKGWVVEVYDQQTKAKKHVKARDYDMEPPRTERQARALERAALNEREVRVGGKDETCDSFVGRWVADYPRPSESSNRHYEGAVRKFGKDFHCRPLRSITVDEGRAWARENPSRVRECRTMYNDAIRAGVAHTNPFSGLGADHERGRHNIIVLTVDELDLLKTTAVDELGEHYGREFAAMIDWAAYTCMRPGEIFAAEYSRLNGDTYDLRDQFNSHVRKRTPPKHGSTGIIYVPEAARQAVLSKPRRISDDLMFRTVTGKEYRAGSLLWAWNSVRVAFTAKLPPSHDLRRRLVENSKDRMDFYELRHFGASYMLNDLELEPWVIAEQLRHKDGGKLVVKLYGHPDRKKAIDRIRRAFGGNVHQIPRETGDSQGISRRGAM